MIGIVPSVQITSSTLRPVPSPCLLHTSRPFGLSSFDGVKAMVNVSVRQINVATPSQFSLRTPFTCTSCSASRHSASASRFDVMGGKHLHSSRRKQVGSVPTQHSNVGTADANNGSTTSASSVRLRQMWYRSDALTRSQYRPKRQEDDARAAARARDARAERINQQAR
jgi:hypothetical protein